MRWFVCAANFTHPVSRRQLLREECVELDTHIRRHRLGRPCLTIAFDHATGETAPATATPAAGGGAGTSRASSSRGGASINTAADAVQQHQREASELLRALFSRACPLARRRYCNASHSSKILECCCDKIASRIGISMRIFEYGCHQERSSLNRIIY
eukprot:COSAG05_NODE_715_length_7805_cov_5.098235_6_plen_157_part_00